MDASRFPATMGGQLTEGSMSFQLVAIDLGKLSFHLHGVDYDGVVLSRKITRSKLFTAVCELAPTRVAMEACPGAHHWGRLFEAAGIRVVLIHPRFVRPFVRGGEERRGGCRSDLRCGKPPNHALRAGKDAGAAGPAGAAPDPRTPGLPAHGADQPNAWPAGRVRDRPCCETSRSKRSSGWHPVGRRNSAGVCPTRPRHFMS